MIPFKASIEPAMQVSKWQKIPMLIDISEMRALFEFLGPFFIIQASGLVKEEEIFLSQERFLSVYEAYIQGLQEGVCLPYEKIKAPFSSLWTTTLDGLYQVRVNETQRLIKQKKPGVQLQFHRFHYSKVDGSFRSMAMGSEAISWGLQFSYPHFYQNEDKSVVVTREESLFPDSILFKNLQKWTREETVVSTFEAEGKIVNVPIRIGKSCLSWIHKHPQLKKGLSFCSK